MSENKDNVDGLDDKGKPKLKDLFGSDVQKQGIASASTNPTERDIDDTEGNLDSLSMEGNASSSNLSEPSGELSDTTQSHGGGAIPASEFELPFSSSIIKSLGPLQPLQENHYLIDFVKRSQQVASIPEFRRENYLFKVQLTAASIMSRRLIVPTEAVRSHFSAVGIPAETHGAFVSEYDLENDDAIKFYKPVQPLNSRHFLIEFVKRGEAVTDTSQSGSAENDGDGDDSGQGGSSRDDGTRGDATDKVVVPVVAGGEEIFGNICAA
ncbi:hypothetical protein Acr_15g0005090 [Actinidia rufa]|uniref:Uncharacterized protein n=1 Tax=Actinidia rufa TaxID=165716 RepID=A0A7J0FUP9_9ERIC|nr:hypothetical protein Acr_15g0005090 [Actinidia rufa]